MSYTKTPFLKLCKWHLTCKRCVRIQNITIWYDNVDGVGLNEILWCSVLSSLLEIALQGQFRLTFTNEPIYTASGVRRQASLLLRWQKAELFRISITVWVGVTVLWFCLLLMMEKCPRSAIMLDWRYGLDDGPPLENYGKNRAIFLKRHDKSKYFSPLELTYTYLELSRSIGRGSDNCWLAILEIKSFSQGFPLKQILLIKTLWRNSNLLLFSSSDENSSPNSSCPISLHNEFML